MSIENRAIAIVAALAPWLAPIPTAWLVYDRTKSHLSWPWWVALFAAATLECIGLAASVTALELREYNRSKRKSDPVAPLPLLIAIALLYFLIAEFLTVALDLLMRPLSEISAVHVAPAAFPVLSLVGVVLLAARADHARRLADIAADKARRSAAQKPSKPKQEERAHSKPDGGFTADCAFCDWSQNGYASARKAQNALNGHMSKHKRRERSADV